MNRTAAHLNLPASSTTLFIVFGMAVHANSLAVLRDMSDGVADVVEKVMPSVVVVQTETTTVPVYRDIFFRPVPGRPQTYAGQGSGVIIDDTGHILTSNHVISGADTINVVIRNGLSFDAELVGQDPHTDLAVVRLKGLGNHDIIPVKKGNSDALRIGEFVIAVGSPFSLSTSVTLGIVSQKNRAIGILPHEDFIQTDAAINPGNSGGPLVDLHGRMIGLNAVIQTAGTRGNIGIGFAVPGNRAFAIAETIISGETVKRPWLGILPKEMSYATARSYLGQEGGVYVAEVFRDTPAYRGGIFQGDVILKVDDEPILSIIDLQRVVFNREIGDTIKVFILRRTQTKELEILTEAMPNPQILQ